MQLSIYLHTANPFNRFAHIVFAFLVALRFENLIDVIGHSFDVSRVPLFCACVERRAWDIVVLGQVLGVAFIIMVICVTLIGMNVLDSCQLDS